MDEMREKFAEKNSNKEWSEEAGDFADGRDKRNDWRDDETKFIENFGDAERKVVAERKGEMEMVFSTAKEGFNKSLAPRIKED